MSIEVESDCVMENEWSSFGRQASSWTSAAKAVANSRCTTKTQCMAEKRCISASTFSWPKGVKTVLATRSILIKKIKIAYPIATTTYPAGRYAYPFRLELPATLPTSVRDLHGFVRYSVKVVVTIPMRRDIKAREEFQVVKPLDLNQFPALQVNYLFLMNYPRHRIYLLFLLEGETSMVCWLRTHATRLPLNCSK